MRCDAMRCDASVLAQITHCTTIALAEGSVMDVRRMYEYLTKFDASEPLLVANSIYIFI